MAAKTRPTRIVLKGTNVFEEFRAGGAIRPGDLVAINSAGQVIKHPSGSVFQAEKMFAVEDALQGNGIDDNYATGDLVFVYIAKPGDVIYGFLSGGEHATPNEYLVSNGDGALKVGSTTNYPVGVPIEEVNATDSNDVDERIRVRIM